MTRVTAIKIKHSPAHEILLEYDFHHSQRTSTTQRDNSSQETEDKLNNGHLYKPAPLT